MLGRLGRFLAFTVGVALVALFTVAPLLMAQVDTTAVVAPGGVKGIAFTFLTGTKVPLIALLTSGLVWLANTGLGVIKDWDNTLKYFVIMLIGAVVSYGVNAFGGQLSPEAFSWGPATAEGVGSGLVNALIFKLGQTHK